MDKIIFIAVFLTFFSCTSKHISKEEREKVRTEMDKRQLKKLTDADILNEGHKIGQSIVDSAQLRLLSELNEIIASQGVISAIPYCNTNAANIISNTNRNFISVKRVSGKPRNKNNISTEQDMEILEAYEYAVQHGITPSAEVRFSNNKKYVLYTKPITIQSTMCLQCHGEVGKEVSIEVAQVIDKYYPQDSAKNYQLYDFRGMWSVQIPMAEVVKDMPEY